MHIMHVHIRIKPEHIEAFQAATIENASHSVEEPGVARFDLIQQADDPTRFMLLEVYRSLHDVESHRATAHYNAWAAKVADMFAEPRTRTFYTNVYPADAGW
ncbi:MAG TPA: antibiotic biosynthesis monooxygenase [Candidatus Solibacter sp.]|nr:antibiotic biosynthesis monooxygenase [Candidatus Solibacter sp.]